MYLPTHSPPLLELAAVLPPATIITSNPSEKALEITSNPSEKALEITCSSRLLVDVLAENLVRKVSSPG